MNRLLIYDISEDRIRTKVASICKDYGLVRVQYSAFFGDLNRNHLEELQKKLKRLLKDRERWSVIIFTLSDDDVKKTIKMESFYEVKELEEAF
ncbi:CRISPR-associated endoribonuclease Cas2 [[Clostridium] ultunense Esp]|nr:CRISPR-associated endoribonuclease Cas2 [[Clostridium] ultunense Esp]